MRSSPSYLRSDAEVLNRLHDHEYNNSRYSSSYLSSPTTGSKYHHVSKYKSGLDILPSKQSVDFSKHTSARSPTYGYQGYSSLTSPISRRSSVKKPSPPTTSYVFTSANENSNNDIVRPSMRDRTSSRYLNGSVGSTSSSYGSRSSSISPVGKTTRKRDSSQPRSRGLPGESRRSSSSSDMKTLGSFTDETYRLSSGSKSVQSTSASFSLMSVDRISIDDPPYKHTKYKPSFVSDRTPSPRRSPSVSSAMSYYSHSRDNASCSSYRSRSDLARQYSRSSSWGNRAQGNGVTGLKNIGNTCFMNSIIQCLSNTRKLRDYCLNSEYLTEINSSSSMKGKLIKAFSEVIHELWSGSVTSVTPSSFKSQIQKFSPRFMGYDQQDSQEFLRFLLEGLHEDINQVQKKSSEPMKDMSRKSPNEIADETWKWYGKKDKSFIFDLFVGQLESRLQCYECGHVSLTYDPFWDLSLSISKSAYMLETATLDDCLRNFTKEETLDRDEKPMCERCKTRRKMKKKLSIHRFPKILVIHLKRFNEGSRYRQKLSNLVTFPVEDRLKLAPYASNTCPDKSLSSYDLYAVSNHCGSCYGGHYTAHCFNPVLKEWYEYSDSRVSRVSESTVCTKEAYVLFYVQHASYSGRSPRVL